MTPSTLRAVTLKTVANYAQVAERAVLAYRVGGHRLIAAMQRGVDLAALNGPERLALALRRAGGNVGGLASKGLDLVSSRTERAIEVSSSGVTQQLARVADLADGVDNSVVAGGLQAAARISLPGAQAALALSERLVAGAAKLPGKPVDQAAAKLRAGVARVRKATQAAKTSKAAKPQASVEAVVQQLSKAGAKARQAAVTEIKAAAKPRAARKSAVKPVAEVAAAPRARRAAAAKPVAEKAKAAKLAKVSKAVAALQDVVAAA